MHALEQLEPEMEEFLRRLAPDRLQQLEGAADAEIDRIEALAARPLPRFYRWFLLRMGRNMGPFAFPTLDCSAPTIVRSYEDDELEPSQRFHLIGFETNDVMPLHLMYDFDYPARDDARVVKMEAPDAQAHVQFETFREMFAWSKFFSLRVKPSPQWCHGLFVSSDGDVLPQLNPVAEGLGLITPASIPTGPHCSLHEGRAAAMITSSSPEERPRIHAFSLGGTDAGVVRRILGEIATQTSLSVEVDRWFPPLA